MKPEDLAARCARLHITYGGRLPARGLSDVREAAAAGEYTEAVDVLLAGLIALRTPVTGTERDELAELAEAAGIDPARTRDLNVTVPGP